MLRTAVDTSVLIDVFCADPRHGQASMQALIQCLEQGTLIACSVVWAEIRPRFKSTTELLGVTHNLGLEFEAINQEAALKAGEVMKQYREQGGKRERLIPDFLVASHALVQCDRLLTRDRGFYRQYFAKLKVMEPGQV